MTTERNTAGNTGFASGGVTCKLGALCFYSSAVLVDSFVLRNPPERKAQNRWLQARNLSIAGDIINSENEILDFLNWIRYVF